MFRQNLNVSRALYGTPNHVKTCYVCKVQGKGFLECRVKRGHSNPDFVGAILDTANPTPKKGARLAGVVKRVDFSVPRVGGAAAYNTDVLSMDTGDSGRLQVRERARERSEYKRSGVR